MGYNIFLMIELAKIATVINPDLSYDEIWSKGEKLYAEFVESPFNVDTEGKYECVELFLRNKVESSDVYMKFLELATKEVREYVDDKPIRIKAEPFPKNHLTCHRGYHCDWCEYSRDISIYLDFQYFRYYK